MAWPFQFSNNNQQQNQSYGQQNGRANYNNNRNQQQFQRGQQQGFGQPQQWGQAQPPQFNQGGQGQRQGFGFAQPQQPNQGGQRQQQAPQFGQMPPPQQFNQQPPFGVGQPQQQQPAGNGGVTFQPLDEKAFNELRKSLESPPPAKEEQNLFPEITFEAPPVNNFEAIKPISFPMDETKNLLRDFIQNEYNGKRFYENMLNQSQFDNHKKIFNEIYADCEKNKNTYQKMYKEIGGNDFSGEDRNIHSNLNLLRGTELAIAEENKSLKHLGTLYESCDSKNAKTITALILNKIVTINNLHMVYSTLHHQN